MDVGAFEGLYSLYCCERGINVHAFEPNPLIFEALRKKLSRYKNVHLYNLALGQTDGTKNFYVPENTPDQSSVLRRPGKLIKVKVERLDNFTQMHPDIIKIDVEGYGYEVLLGAHNMLKILHPKIILEFHSIKEYKSCKDYLKKIGYTIKLIDYWKDHSLKLVEDVSTEKCVSAFGHQWLRPHAYILFDLTPEA